METKQLAIRPPVDLFERLERCAARATEQLEGLAVVTRSDVVRVVLDRGPASLEAPRPAPQGGG